MDPQLKAIIGYVVVLAAVIACGVTGILPKETVGPLVVGIAGHYLGLQVIPPAFQNQVTIVPKVSEPPMLTPPPAG